MSAIPPTPADRDIFGIARRQGYDRFYPDFRWHIPERFNFATDVVDAWAAHQDGLALVWENETGEQAELHFSDMAQLSGKLADVLARQGVRKGDRVLVMLPRIPAWHVALTACLRIGAVAVPCIEMLTARDVTYRARNAEARAIICRAVQVAKFADVAEEVFVRIAIGGAPGWLDYDDVMASASPEVTPAIVAAEDPTMMYYTSGSTGHPKGVLHAARALYAWRVCAIYWLDLDPRDRIWCTADTGWSKAATSIIIGPWSCGACAFFYDGPFAPADRLRLLAKHKITVYCAPATELNRVVHDDPGQHDLTALRRTVSAGEPMNPAVAERWQDATGAGISEAYGLTEALMIALNYPSEPVKIGSMGRPAPGCTVAIVDDAGYRLAIGEEGHIAVLAPNPQMMLGYWKEQELTESRFVESPEGRWFLTGDLGIEDEDGYIWFAGRSDDVINSAGYRIGPLEVENALLEHDGVQECAVVSSPDEARGEVVKAFIVLRDGLAASATLIEELQNHVKSVTAPYKYPRAIEIIDELPKTITGKILRRELRDKEWGR